MTPCSAGPRGARTMSPIVRLANRQTARSDLSCWGAARGSFDLQASMLVEFSCPESPGGAVIHVRQRTTKHTRALPPLAEEDPQHPDLGAAALRAATSWRRRGRRRRRRNLRGMATPASAGGVAARGNSRPGTACTTSACSSTTPGRPVARRSAAASPGPGRHRLASGSSTPVSLPAAPPRSSRPRSTCRSGLRASSGQVRIPQPASTRPPGSAALDRRPAAGLSAIVSTRFFGARRQRRHPRLWRTYRAFARDLNNKAGAHGQDGPGCDFGWGFTTTTSNSSASTVAPPPARDILTGETDPGPGTPSEMDPVLGHARRTGTTWSIVIHDNRGRIKQFHVKDMNDAGSSRTPGRA